MKVSTILVSKEDAQRKLEQYISIAAKRRTKEDDKLQSLYAAVSKGARVLNLASAFKETGLNAFGQPKLAIARADWKTVHCFRSPARFGNGFSRTKGSVGFSDNRRWNPQATARNILLPDDTFTFDASRSWWNLFSPVPHLPPQLRPRYALHNYHILFEVKTWEVYPVDPFLLRRIAGMLFVVEAEWELTELEASLLSGLMLGN